MKLKLQKEKEERSKAELERQLTAKVAGSEH